MAAGWELLTYDDLRPYPDDDGMRREILEGHLEVTPSPSVRHQRAVAELMIAIGMHLRAHGGGTVLSGPIDVRLSEHDVLVPDVIFIADDRREIIAPHFIEGAPSIVVEVVSDSRRDRVRKRDIYSRCGVPEYWVVDPEADRVEIHHLGPEGTYGAPEVLVGTDSLTTSALPGLEIEVRSLFEV